MKLRAIRDRLKLGALRDRLKQHVFRDRLVLFVAALILVGTLFPTRGLSGPSLGEPSCPLCGERGFADALANILLFIPFGVALARTGTSARFAFFVGAAFSCTIEVVQMFVPGRDPNPSDILFNSLGALIGAFAWIEIREAIRTRSVASEWPSVIVAALVAGGLTTSAFLFRVAPTPAPPFVLEWAPEAPGREPLPGRVMTVQIAGRHMTEGIPDDQPFVWRSLNDRRPVRIIVQLDRPTDVLTPLLRIRDRNGVDFLEIAIDGTALVAHVRTRAAALRLDQPDLRVEGALPTPLPTGPIPIRFSTYDRGYCFVVNEKAYCGAGFNLADSWGLLLYPPTLDLETRRMLGLVWLGALGGCIGLLTRRRSALALYVLATIGLFLNLPRLAEIRASPREQVLAALGGLIIGHVVGSGLRYFAAMRRGRAPRPKAAGKRQRAVG